MIRRLSVIFLTVAAAPAVAQQVSVQPIAVSPMSSTVVLGSLVDVDTTSTIPSTMISGVNDGAGNQSLAVSSFGLQETLGLRKLTIVQSIGVTNAGGLAASAASASDIRFEISATSPTSLQLELVIGFAGSPGAPLPVVTIDVGDDGIIEHQGLGPSLGLSPVWVGATPFPVRVKTATQIAGNGQSSLGLDLIVRPFHGPQIAQAVAGCSAWVGADLEVAADFDKSLTFFAGPFPSVPPVLVLGLSAQPVLLPPFGVPCVLWPSPDILLPLASSPTTAPTLVLPLPPAVLPVNFWVQAVLIEPVGLLPTRAFSVQAN